MRVYKKHTENGNLRNATHIEVSVLYDKGGNSWVNGRAYPRGYYISVTPVTIKNGMVSFILGSGCRKLLFETNRYSEKQFNRAVEMSGDAEPELVAMVEEKNKVA